MKQLLSLSVEFYYFLHLQETYLSPLCFPCLFRDQSEIDRSAFVYETVKLSYGNVILCTTRQRDFLQQFGGVSCSVKVWCQVSSVISSTECTALVFHQSANRNSGKMLKKQRKSLWKTYVVETILVKLYGLILLIYRKYMSTHRFSRGFLKACSCQNNKGGVCDITYCAVKSIFQ